MNHSKKTIILVLSAMFFGILLTSSFAYAQTSLGSISNTANPVSKKVHVIPYHPRDPVTYAAEKQHLDSLIQNSHPLQVNTQSLTLSALSQVNNYSGIEGLDAASSGLLDPPDVSVAVGPNHVVEMVNLAGQIWTKNDGSLVQTITLSSFFGLSNSHILGESKIIFDNRSGTDGRWFATLLDLNNGTISLKVSKTSDPTGLWYPPMHDSTDVAYCPDNPNIGVSDDKFVIALNDYPTPCPASLTVSDGVEYHVFNKTALINGKVSMQSSDNLVGYDFGIVPVQSLSSTNSLYMVSDGAANTNQIKLYTITGQVPNVNFNSPTFLSIRQIHLPSSAFQPTTTGPQLDTGDQRVLDAAWYKGKLWTTLDDGCVPTGDSLTRSCIRLIQINTNTTKVTQDFDINSTATYYYYPALRLDGFGGLGVAFGVSSSSIYPSLLATAQATTDPKGSTMQLTTLKSGSQYEDDTFGSLASYGHYFGASSDPSDPARVWVAGEYNAKTPSDTQPTWSTFMDSFSFDCKLPTTGDWTISASCTLAGNATAPANVVVQNNAVLTIPNKQTLNIDFAHYHLLVQSGSGVYIASNGKIA